ncbi:TPA: phage portal protein [Salmonella enterica]|uniref:Phage portal protein n=1 Tax=Salmonella enterica TaxID=28901 RepID=A0A754E6Q2_SALER|nr:phage portal protein [Salmonella enterica]
MSPGWAVSRLRSRAVIKAYEAAIPTRTHKIKRENRNANQLNQIAGKSLREQARWFDNNHDLVVGALDKMEERVIGAKGIIVEPQPLTVAGTLNNALAEQIRARWAEWSVSPDVTGQYTRPVLERLLLRTWLRDGEVFSQMVAGKMPGLEPVAGVPFWLEAMEPDYVPMEQTDSTNNLIQGIYFNDWQRPKSYIVCKSWPGFATAMVATKLIDAENMLHLKFTRRLNQARGVTLLAPVIIRLLDLKEYEDSERLAARISAAFAMFIRRSDAMVQDGDAPDYADKDRDLDIEPGTILKDLLPGEDIGTIKSDRPNANLDGMACSMASAIAMVGNPIIMPENAMMMIHKPRGVAGGEAEDIREYADLLDKIESVIIPIYTEKTGKTPEDIAAMLAKETWMSGAECVSEGFADKLIQPVKAMACIHSKRVEEFEHMPQSIKGMIIAPQGNAGAQPQPQAKAPESQIQSQAQSLVTVDENAIRARLQEEQRNRITGIQNVFSLSGDRYASLMAKCIADVDCSLEMAKDRLLAEMAKGITPTNQLNGPQNRAEFHAGMYTGNGNITGDAVRAAVMARAGYEEAQKDNPYNCMTLRELARISLVARGTGVSSMNPMQMIGMAFTHSTSDFGNILLDVANKSILQGWQEAPETFDVWTKKGQLSDFRIVHRVGMGGFSSLRQVREGAEYKYVTTGDKQATIALATYGELFSITRQAIINDDMNMLTDVPMKLGRAAKATIADLVYDVLISNQKLSSDNVALFDKTKHANVLEKAVMDVASLDKARQLMRMQKEGDRHLNIRPAFVLVPTAMESVSNQVIKSVSVKGADINAGIINPVKDFATVIAEPRLDDASQSTFYLTAAKGSDTVEVAYLNGVDEPYIDQQEGFTVDGVTTKVRIDAGVAPVDYRGMVKCTV